MQCNPHDSVAFGRQNAAAALLAISFIFLSRSPGDMASIVIFLPPVSAWKFVLSGKCDVMRVKKLTTL
jgi:hypothetical protein